MSYNLTFQYFSFTCVWLALCFGLNDDATINQTSRRFNSISFYYLCMFLVRRAARWIKIYRTFNWTHNQTWKTLFLLCTHFLFPSCVWMDGVRRFRESGFGIVKKETCIKIKQQQKREIHVRQEKRHQRKKNRSLRARLYFSPSILILADRSCVFAFNETT